MSTDLTMPKLGLTMEEVELLEELDRRLDQEAAE